MSETTRKNLQKTYPNKANVYAEFIIWFTLPRQERIRLGLETQEQFAEFYGVNPHTLAEWKKRPDFEARLDSIIKQMGTEKTADVLQGMYVSAMKGNARSQLLWLQYFKKFNPNAKDKIADNQVVITVDDIRFLIEALPEPLKQKHYDNLRELLDDSAAVMYAIDQGAAANGLIELENGDWAKSPEAEDVAPEKVTGVKDNTAAGPAKFVPRRYPVSTCAGTERQVTAS